MGMSQSQMAGTGLSAAAQVGICGGVSDAIAAAGSASTDATELKRVGTHFVATTAASTGVRIPTGLNPGEGMELFNGGASTLAVYPPAGGTINNLTATTGNFDVATTKSVLIRCINPLKFLAMLGA